MHIYPSILTDSTQLAQKQLEKARSMEDVTTVQLDIIDGYFTDNLTLNPATFTELEFGELQADFHLMVQEPLEFVYEILDYQDILPTRAIISQVEQMSNQQEYLHEIKKNKLMAGLSLNLFTPLEAIESESWKNLDVIQVMGIEAGFQGKEFHSHAFETIKAVQEKISSLDHTVELIVDGGIKPENIAQLKKLGVESIAVGSALWKAEDSSKAIESLV